MKITDRMQNAWNAFFNKDPTQSYKDITYGSYFGSNPDTRRKSFSVDRTIVNSIYNRIAVDVAQLEFKHVQLDEDCRYLSDVDSGLNRCLNFSANWDQTGRSFMQDFVSTLLEEGVAVMVPTDVDTNPMHKESFDILEMRVGIVKEWYPAYVKVEVYNERKMKREEIVLAKDSVSIITNPFYSIMNEPSSTLKRLSRKLSLLDQTDERSSSGKLDIVIQLPFAIKGEYRKSQAVERQAEIESQLINSPHGIAYLDSTEHITQLNRPVENHLLQEIKDLTADVFTQLCMTPEILNGTADEKTMLKYQNGILEPIASAICDEMKRKFLSRTAITQMKSVMFFRDPFKLIPIGEFAELADKLTRNEIMTSNEIRQKMGMKPSNDPEADMLRNKNLNAPETTGQPEQGIVPDEGDVPMEEIQNG